MSWKNTFKLDEALAFETGYQIDFYDALGNVIKSVWVRYAGPSNKAYNTFKNAFMKPHERKAAMGNMPEAESDKLTQECFVRGGIITKWSDDTPITVESFRAAMVEAPPETWRDILNTAYTAKYYVPVTQAAEAGN